MYKTTLMLLILPLKRLIILYVLHQLKHYLYLKLLSIYTTSHWGLEDSGHTRKSTGITNITVTKSSDLVHARTLAQC